MGVIESEPGLDGADGRSAISRHGPLNLPATVYNQRDLQGRSNIHMLSANTNCFLFRIWYSSLSEVSDPI